MASLDHQPKKQEPAWMRSALRCADRAVRYETRDELAEILDEVRLEAQHGWVRPAADF